MKATGWQTKESAPKDGTHILVCSGPYSQHWTFNQRPPMVVHFHPDPNEPGFYLSSGIVQDSYNDKPIDFTNWRPLGPFPTAITDADRMRGAWECGCGFTHTPEVSKCPRCDIARTP